jgi:hypothetical protein
MSAIILIARPPILFVALRDWLVGQLKLFGPKATTTLSTFVVRFAPTAAQLSKTHSRTRRRLWLVQRADCFVAEVTNAATVWSSPARAEN